jgi:Domain of unknown function (DUF6316)
MKQLDTEKNPAAYRTSRMYRENDNWFFKTREGDTAGPFRDELEASTQLEVYIRLANTGLLPLYQELRVTAAPNTQKKASAK